MQTTQSTLPLVEHILPFLDYCEVEKGLSNNTQKNYHKYLQRFVTWLRRTGNERLLPHELTQNHVWDYRLFLARTSMTPRGTKLSKRSQNYYLIALRALLNYLTERDIEALPASKIKLAKHKSEDTVSFLDVHDVEKLLAVPDRATPTGIRDRAIMELLFSSGMRISELVALNADQVSFFDDTSETRTYELSIVGKGKHVRTVFISPRAAHWLREYLSTRHDVYKPLFLNVHSKDPDNRRLSPRSIQAMISKCAMLAGLSKKVTPHTLRHTYATDLLAHGADLRSVQELLGHKNVATTQIYTHVTNRQLRDIHEQFHGGRELRDLT